MIALVAHLQAAAERHVVHLSLEFLRKGGQLRLVLGVGARDNQSELLVEDTEAALSVEIVLIVDSLRVDDTRETYLPGSGLANARGYAHLIGVARLILRNGLRRSFVVIESVLRQSPQPVHVKVVPMKETGQKLGIVPSVGKI